MKNKNLKVNSVILGFLILITIFGCVYFLKSYKIHKEKDLNTPIMLDYLNEIKINELNEYTIENPNPILYVCSPNKENCREFEESFKKIIEKYDLREYILYLNANENKNELQEKIPTLNEKDFPTILIYNNKEIIEISKIETTDDILKLLDKYEVNYLND